MHLDLFVCLTTDAARFSQLRACSQADYCSYDINVAWVSALKGEFALCPVPIEEKADLAVCFSPLSFYAESQFFSKALEDLWHGELVFLCQRLCQGEFQDILDSGQVFPVVYEAVVVLESTIDSTV